MAQILFPQSHAPGKDAVEGSGSLVNAYAEPLQEGGPSGYVIRRPPGLTQFATTDETEFRGCWFDGVDTLYAAFTDKLYAFDSAGVATEVDDLYGARISFINSYVDTSNTTAYTYSSVPIGPAQAARRIVVGVYFNNSNDSPATVTIGGVSATSIVTQSSLLAIFLAVVPTGTTADVVVTYATAATSSAIGVWKIEGADGSSAYDTAGDQDSGASNLTPSTSLSIPKNGVALAVASTISPDGAPTFTWSGLTEKFDVGVEGADQFSGASLAGSAAQTITVSASTVTGGSTAQLVAASWGADTGISDFVTFAKNNASTPDQVLVSPIAGAYSFTLAGGVSSVDVNSLTPNSVCFGEGYFFFTIADGQCYASNLNSTTVTGTDYIRAEARAEPLVRGVFYSGELFLFGETHTEVWASNGNPNATGFPLNRTAVMYRGLLAPGAVCGFEEGFEGQLIWVADDNSVRMLNGYSPQVISPPDLERDIEDCAEKSNIRCWVYDLDGHACVGVHIPGVSTWVYDLSTGNWHTRKSLDAVDCRLSGNTVKAFDKWIGGDTDSGDLLYLDDTAYTEVSDAMTFEVESIAMEAFPQRLQVSRADFNFVGGVGTTTTPDPMVKISWSDDGGHTWSDPVSRKLGEAGRYLEQVRVNRVGLTKHKGRRWRLQVSDQVYVGLLGGSMEVSGRP